MRKEQKGDSRGVGKRTDEEDGMRWTNYSRILTVGRRRLQGGNVAADKSSKALKLVREVARAKVGVETGDVENAAGQSSRERACGMEVRTSCSTRVSAGVLVTVVDQYSPF